MCFLRVPLFLVTTIGITGLTSAVDQPATISPESQKTLMIGNSLTYAWNIPNILKSLAAETNRKLEITVHATGGKDLAWHWVNPVKSSGTTTQEVITKTYPCLSV